METRFEIYNNSIFLNCFFYNFITDNCYKMNKIAVFGLGKVGTLVGILLSEQFSVIGYDIHPPYYEIELPFEYKILDIGRSTSNMPWRKLM